MLIDAIDHVQLAMPPGGEAAAVRFYEGVLGIPQIAKPDDLAARGGCWFERGALRVHLGVQEGFVPATKAHPAFAVVELDLFVSTLEADGVEHERITRPDGERQVYVHDPFGNRLEFRDPRPTGDVAAGMAVAVDAAQAAGGDAFADRMRFVAELDRLRSVERRTLILDALRRENTGEHSWHVAMIALVFADVFDPDVDVQRVVQMLLVHDIVEIDAGDTFHYDTDAAERKAIAERAAADRLYGLLPEPTGARLRALWEEYEHGDTPDGRTARAIDRLAPMLINIGAGAITWVRAGITKERVRHANRGVAGAGGPFETLVDELLDRAESAGMFDHTAIP